MSHKDEQIICPNCGHHATGNYCSQCGQETHLHDENFFSLIMHFIGHYFHYDSKFWKTMVALFANPGKLTIAYWNKQRMRYIPPISLYIFISVVFFLVYSLLPFRHSASVNHKTKNADSVFAAAESEAPPIGRSIIHSFRESLDRIDSVDKNDSMAKVDLIKAEVMKKKMEQDKDGIKEHAFHMLPKVFFFLIPLMGLVLLLLFRKRKELGYVSHIIFALHYHTLWFTIMLLEQFYRFHKGYKVVLLSALGIAAIYFVIALKKTYGIGWLRSLWYSVIVGIAYAILLGIAGIAVVMIIAMPYIKMASESVVKP